MLTYKDMEDAVAQIEYKDWNLKIGMDGERLYLQVQYYERCNKTSKVEVQSGRKWFLSQFMTKSELVQTAFKAVLTAEEHEVRERFRYRDQQIYGPHYNVDVLAEVCATGMHEEKRRGNP